jgi:hypothetical protein
MKTSGMMMMASDDDSPPPTDYQKRVPIGFWWIQRLSAAELLI